MQIAAVLCPAVEGGYIAYDLATGTTTQGETMTDATNNLREAVELYTAVFDPSGLVKR